MNRERAYQKRLVEKLKLLFPSCFIVENDPTQNQGVPDLLILFGVQWAMLEVKAAKNSPVQPNQLYWVDYFNNMSFAAFVYPENEKEVLSALQDVLGLKQEVFFR